MYVNRAIVAKTRENIDNFDPNGYNLQDASTARVIVGLVAQCVYVTRSAVIRPGSFFL